MSASVIRRGLELFSEEDGEKRKQRRISCNKQGVKRQRISCNKQGVTRQMRAAVRSKTTVKDKRIRSAVDEYRKKQKKSQLTSNLEYFLGADYKTQTSHTGKVIQQNSGRRACHQPDLPDSRPEEKSVFTEEEFQKFQEEYFSNR